MFPLEPVPQPTYPPCLQAKGKEGNPMRIGRAASVVKARVRHIVEVVLAIITIILHGETGTVLIERDGEAYVVPVIYTGMSTL